MSATTAKHPSVVFRLGHMGDVALTTGVLAHWHEISGETFVFVTRESNLPLLENHPAVAQTIGLNHADLKDGGWVKKTGELARQYSGHTLLDLHGSLRSRILGLRWKGKVRRYPKFGLTRRLFEQTRVGRLRTKLEALNVPQRYALAQDETAPAQKDLLPRIYLTDREQIDATALLALIRGNKPLIGLHPYATHPAKQWPPKHWLSLIDLLEAARMDWFVVGRSTAPLKQGDARDLTNVTGLRETCGLLDQADLLVTGDSGPMHLACGVGTPVVALFGPTARAWGFYPAGPKDVVLERDLDCRPCSLHGAKACPSGFECMAGIAPETVLEAIRFTLG